MSRPDREVADVVRQHGEAFLKRDGQTLCSEQHRALRAIELCDTAALGGHKTRGDSCGNEGCASNPCRIRHCPQCQGVTRAQSGLDHGACHFWSPRIIAGALKCPIL